MRRILVTHVDGDGLAGYLVATYFNDKVPPEKRFDKIVCKDYGFETSDFASELETFDHIVIADLSIPREYYERLLGLGKQVSLFDHHDSSKKLIGLPGVVHDERYCGAEVFYYNWYGFERHNPTLIEFLSMVSIYDRWKWNHSLWDEGLNINRVLYGRALWNEKDDTPEKYIFWLREARRKIDSREPWQWTSEELDAIQRAVDKEDKSFKEACGSILFRKDSNGKIFGVFKLGSKISIVCHRLFRETNLGEHLDYLLVINTYKGISGKLSGRSIDDRFPVNSLLPLNGHFNAAGGTILPEQAVKLYEENVCLPKRKNFDPTQESREDDNQPFEDFETAQPVNINWKHLRRF